MVLYVNVYVLMLVVILFHVHDYLWC